MSVSVNSVIFALWPNTIILMAPIETENCQHWKRQLRIVSTEREIMSSVLLNTKPSKIQRYTKVHISLSLMHQLSIVITVREGERISQKAVSNLFFMILRKICPNQFYKKRTYMNIAVDLVKSPVSF